MILNPTQRISSQFVEMQRSSGQCCKTFSGVGNYDNLYFLDSFQILYKFHVLLLYFVTNVNSVDELACLKMIFLKLQKF